MTPLAELLGDVRAAAAFRYDAHDSAGNRMDTAKVIAGPAGGYLAVYHDHETCHLATSTDLMTWTHQAVVDEPAIAGTGGGGLLTAAEFNDGQGGQIRVRYWPTLDAVAAGRPAREFLAPRTLSACNEGTPSVRRISLGAASTAHGSSSASTTTAAAGSTARPLAPSPASGPGPRPGTRSWTRPWSGPRRRSPTRRPPCCATRRATTRSW